jgi:hypothetical protein
MWEALIKRKNDQENFEQTLYLFEINGSENYAKKEDIFLKLIVKVNKNTNITAKELFDYLKDTLLPKSIKKSFIKRITSIFSRN